MHPVERYAMVAARVLVTTLDPGRLPPHLCSCPAAVSDTSDTHGTSILEGNRYFSVSGSAECMYGWWLDLHNSDKKSANPAVAVDSKAISQTSIPSNGAPLFAT